MEKNIFKIPLWESNPPITKEQYKLLKLDFFQTAHIFGGSKEIWKTIQASLEMEDKNKAQLILEAADIKIPQNILECYDSKGYKYEIPPYLISEPINLIKEKKKRK
ncbi:ubiquitin domain containing 1 protein-related [Anaeramoeba ignava]|uniref:Ubiquitin domain containing 1 protein-related n=1 Tax=Anaeramoeba ignava TaxID=1746090 RepID=A0A9Q0LP01_ANAIG|nr:ubiquitin domain containing 1 protein-related [Anaeramoeba ignava]